MNIKAIATEIEELITDGFVDSEGNWTSKANEIGQFNRQIDEIQRSAPELYKMLRDIIVEGRAITNAAQLINSIRRNILETSCVDHVERTVRWHAISPKKELITAGYVDDSTGVWTDKAVGCAHWDLCSEIQVLSDYSFAMYETLEGLLAGTTTVEELARLLADIDSVALADCSVDNFRSSRAVLMCVVA